VEHRHLLPSEIDLLLDGEEGFGTSPLKAHVRRCPRCRAELDEARATVAAIEHLPHFSPSPQFADRVLARVNIFVPWHVAVLDTVRGLIPRSRGGRVAFGLAAGSVAAVMSLVVVWIALRFDATLFAVGLLAERLRLSVLDGVGSVLAGALGDSAYTLVRSTGLFGLSVLTLLLILAMLLVATVLRSLAINRRR
jgi:anti-sigma factor RsiW